MFHEDISQYKYIKLYFWHFCISYDVTLPVFQLNIFNWFAKILTRKKAESHAINHWNFWKRMFLVAI